MRNSRQDRRRLPTAWRIRQLAFSRGCTRNSSPGPTRIRGRMTKVWAFDSHSESLGEAPADMNLRAVLTWISIYWFSRDGPAASVRIYYEMAKVGGAIQLPKTSVPVGVSFFPKELARSPKAYVFLSSFPLAFLFSSFCFEVLTTQGML